MTWYSRRARNIAQGRSEELPRLGSRWRARGHAPQNVLQSEDLLFAEVDMDFHASKERTDFPSAICAR